MAHYSDDDIYPVTRITAGAVGEPGRRVFVLQAQIGQEILSWVIEKGQAVALSRAIPELLAEVRAQFPELDEPLVAARPNLALSEPLEPKFRVGALGVSYDAIHDLVVLTLVDLNAEPANQLMTSDGFEESAETYVYATRGQAFLLSLQAESAVAAGRPYCPNCGEPMDEFGHFCLPAAVRSRSATGYLQ